MLCMKKRDREYNVVKQQMGVPLMIKKFLGLMPTLLLTAAVIALAGRIVHRIDGLVRDGMEEMREEAVPTMQTQQTLDWGVGYGDPGTRPRGNVSEEELRKYNAYYLGEDGEKMLYLTFDCGYENGNTEAILDALKKHNTKATFFVVGHFLETAPELVCRMVEEGHTVGNHTYHHPDMTKITDRASFQKEMDGVEQLFTEVTGGKMAKYYRPPQGKYNPSNLAMAKELGYATFFWSLAHVDWKTDAQPSREEALEKLTLRVHPGAIVLLHNTSRTNGEILDELLTKWEEMGYRFGVLEDIISQETFY